MDNVVAIRKSTPVFSHELRTKLEDGLRPISGEPALAIKEVEHIICAHIIEIARQAASRAGEALAKKIFSVGK